jgi:hypothetical protein
MHKVSGLEYSGDVLTEEEMRWATSPYANSTGGAHGANGEHDTLPLGLHHSPAERQTQRLARAGIVVIRTISNRKR